MYKSLLYLQVDMLQEENESILDKVPWSTLFCQILFSSKFTSFISIQVFLKCSSDSRKRDARNQRPELGSLRSRYWLCLFFSSDILTMVCLFLVDATGVPNLYLLTALFVINIIFRLKYVFDPSKIFKVQF